MVTMAAYEWSVGQRVMRVLPWLGLPCADARVTLHRKCMPGCLKQWLTRSAAAGAQNIDLVIEGTGVFLDRAGAGKHLQAGAKKVRA